MDDMGLCAVCREDKGAVTLVRGDSASAGNWG